MDFKTNISYKKLVDRENYKEYIKQVGYKTKRKNEIQLDEMVKLRGQLKEIYKKRYIMK
jgi:hypothetical protein